MIYAIVSTVGRAPDLFSGKANISPIRKLVDEQGFVIVPRIATFPLPDIGVKQVSLRDYRALRSSGKLLSYAFYGTEKFAGIKKQDFDEVLVSPKILVIGTPNLIVRLLTQSVHYRPTKIFGFTPGADIRDIYPAFKAVTYRGFTIDPNQSNTWLKAYDGIAKEL